MHQAPVESLSALFARTSRHSIQPMQATAMNANKSIDSEKKYIFLSLMKKTKASVLGHKKHDEKERHW
ncbi:MAG: hypothetical protein EPN57_14755 [Paraburkholderia sp.]|nr:MAG: hypothetical protein EPN57_14755 [Paraburkholderia sp.]